MPDDPELDPRAMPPLAQPSDPYAMPIEGTPDSNEGFYIDENGFKDDTKFHERIIRDTDWPIDEDIMGPIREKHRRKRMGDAAWDESKHPRGQPENAGQFGPGGGGSSATTSGGDRPRDFMGKVRALRIPIPATGKMMGERGGFDRYRLLNVYRAEVGEPTRGMDIEEVVNAIYERRHPPEAAETSNATRLYKASTKTGAEIAASVPGATEAAERAVARLATVVSTDKTPAEGGYKNANGTYTPARAAIHEAIVQKFINPETVRKYTPEPGQSPLLTILGGRGGSGKSWLTSEDGPIDTSKSLVIDSDEVKSMLPEYEGWNAAQLHEESSDIVAMIDARAAQIGMNVVLDGTLKSTNIQKRIDVYQAPPSHEYELEGYYMYAHPEIAATRAMNRFKTEKGDFSGRFVPPEVILGNTNNEKNFDAMSKDFRKWGVYDSNEGHPPRLVERGGKRRG